MIPPEENYSSPELRLLEKPPSPEEEEEEEEAGGRLACNGVPGRASLPGEGRPWERRASGLSHATLTSRRHAGTPALPPSPQTSLFISEKVPPSPFILFLGSGGRSVWKLHLGDGGDKGTEGNGGDGGGRGDLGHQGEVQNAEGASLIAL